MMNLSHAVAAAIGTAEYEAVAPSDIGSGDIGTRPILQLNRVPTTLNTSLFENARSGSNPNGSLTSLFALRQLVDPVPGLGRIYSPTGKSTQRIYQQWAHAATVLGDAPFAARVVAESQRLLQENSFANMDGTSGSWGPVYAKPEDWYTNDVSRFRSLKVDLSTNQPSGGGFDVLGGEDQLEWRLGNSTSGELSSGTRLKSLEMKYMMVGFRRPWFNSLLFDTDDWYLSGQDAGFCSSGNVSNNNGVLPLIPTAMLIGRNVSITADWSDSDSTVLNHAESRDETASLGPFMLAGPQGSDSVLQIIGWISSPLPFSPKITREAPGSISVKNTGAFVARFSVDWMIDSQAHHESSGEFPVLATNEVDIPLQASKIVVKIEIMTFPMPFETWSTVKTINLDEPATKRYVVSGTTMKPNIALE